MPTEGELWARRELDSLRSDGYGPRAWGDLIGHSLRRSRETALTRPERLRRARLWGAAGVVVAAGAPVVLRRAGLPAPSRSGFVAWAMAEAAMLEWHLGMVEGCDGSAARLDGADLLTLARAWSAPICLRAPASPRFAAALLTATALSDLLDGPLARRHGATRLGASIDPVADVSVLAGLAIGARRESLLSRAAAATLVLRITVSASRSAWTYLGHGSPPPAPWRTQTRPAAIPVSLGLEAAFVGAPRVGSWLVGAGSIVATAQMTVEPLLRLRGRPRRRSGRTGGGGAPTGFRTTAASA